MIVPILQVANWGREVEASCLSVNSSQILCSSNQQNPLGVSRVLGVMQGAAASGQDLALQKPTVWKSGEPCKILVVLASSCRRRSQCEGNVRNGIPWHVKLVWAGSVLQYNVAFLNWESTKGLRLPSAFSCSTPSPLPLADDYFASVYVLFQ